MARVKLAYPKIPGSKDAPDGQCLAFEKYDGTNMHWRWERELGWYAFGMRRNRYDLDEQGIAEFNAQHAGYEDAPRIFLETLAEPLLEKFASHDTYQSNEITVFTEYVGANSFAGLHQVDDPKQLVLFDVETDQGIIHPEPLVRDFADLNIARVVYRGKLTGKFIHDVREGKYDVTEGVVCKGVHDGQVWMVKIKTNAYMQRLKDAFESNWEDYWE